MVILDRLGSINGKVVKLENGKPVRDASVIIVNGSGTFPDIASLTDSEGWFSIDNLPSGEWVLRAYGPDGETGEVRITVTNNSVTTVINVSRLMGSSSDY